MPSTCNWAIKAAMRLCGLLLLAASGCGGGDSGGGQPMTLENLYCFGSSSTDALGPNGGLIQGMDGNFYGTTSGGGIGGGPQDKTGFYSGNGTIFKITPTGEETVFHLFVGPPTDVANPNALIQGSDGNFYGTAGGKIFKLTPAGVETILDTSDPLPNIYGLIQGMDGNFYGTTSNASGAAVFKLTPDGVFTTLYTFGTGADPGTLLQGSDGNIYGATTSNSGTTFGTIFRITPEGVETLLHTFAGPPDDGWNPLALVQGSDGNLYGTTVAGGVSGQIDGGWGIAFKLTPEGVETVLHSFTAGSDGASPGVGLLQGKDGNFYGTTESGIFRLTPAGVVTGLYAFPGYPGANQPESKLVQGSDGNLYGTTYQDGGGVDQGGCFFRFVLN